MMKVPLILDANGLKFFPAHIIYN